MSVLSRLPVELEPKFITVLREGYRRADFLRDLQAGIVVGVVALPLAIAFAIASGVRPEQGLYTAIIAGGLISLLGGSRVQIGGPTGAFVVLVAGVVAEHGYEGLVVATLLAGALLVAMGMARLGSVIRFIPYPVTVGFTSGIALLIAVGQLPEALGVVLADPSPELIPRLRALGTSLDAVSLPALSLWAGTGVVVVLWPRISSRVPGPLVALLGATLLVHLLRLPVETIGSRFGDVPDRLPSFQFPRVELARVPELLSPALAIALLAGIESLLSAVVADGMTGRRHRANAELVAQGVANLASPLFGGIPATGAIARTATNVKNGGRTPVAGIVHALFLLLVLTTLGRWVALVPMAALAGILTVVAYNMSEWKVFLGLLRGPRSDVLVLLSTFVLTLLVDLTVAIQVGVVLASLLFMRRMAEVSQVRAVTGELEERGGFEEDLPATGLPPHTEVFEVGGSFFFGAAQRFGEALTEIHSQPRVVILRMRDVFAMDATGIHALEQVRSRFNHAGITLVLSGVRSQPMLALVRSGVLDRLGQENVTATFPAAVARAWEVVRDEAPPSV